jgi:hypothetical protein
MTRVKAIADELTAPPAGPLRVTITAEQQDLEHVAVALAMSIARSDARLFVRKAAGVGEYVVESAPLPPAEHAQLVDGVQSALLDGPRRGGRGPPDELEPEHEQ